jgi:hypothetical protein
MATRHHERALLLLAVVAATLPSCDSDSVGSDVEIDHLDMRLVPAREFYPVHDTVRAPVVAIETDGTPHPVGLANWRSLDPTVATVDDQGLIRMLAPGTATIRADAFDQTVQVQLLIKGLLHFAPIQSSETWMAADSPHVVQGNLTVSSVDTAVLTIEPGFGVLFRSHSGPLFGEIHPGPTGYYRWRGRQHGG